MNRLFFHLLRQLTVLFAIGFFLHSPVSALSLNKHGLGPPLPCGQYQVRSKINFEGGKALSADSMEYGFNVKMSEGAGGGECGPETGTYIATISARWDGKAGRATETIHHQSPAIGKLTEVISACPVNPWTAEQNPDCTLVSVTTDNRLMNSPAIAGPYPVTAYYAGYAMRKEIARLVNWTASSDFILPPTTAPQIVSARDGVDIDGGFYRRSEDVKGIVRRPSDGSPEWYAKNLKGYDVEIQVKTNSGDGWLSKGIVSGISAESGAFTISHARLFDDADTNWSVENFGDRGFYRTVRMRARLHDDTVSRPWSSWRGIQVEVPLRLKNAPVAVPPKPLGLSISPKTGGG